MAAPPAPAQAAPAVLPAAPHQTAPVILKKPTKVKDVKAIQVTDPKVATQMRACGGHGTEAHSQMLGTRLKA